MARNAKKTARIVPKTPPPPDHLEPPEALLWASLTEEYEFGNDPAALAILRTALEAHMRARRCRASVDKVGELVRDRFRQPKPHPLLAAERDARAAFLAAMRLLNLDIPGG